MGQCCNQLQLRCERRIVFTLFIDDMMMIVLSAEKYICIIVTLSDLTEERRYKLPNIRHILRIRARKMRLFKCPSCSVQFRSAPVALDAHIHADRHFQTVRKTTATTTTTTDRLFCCCSTTLAQNSNLYINCIHMAASIASGKCACADFQVVIAYKIISAVHLKFALRRSRSKCERSRRQRRPQRILCRKCV